LPAILSAQETLTLTGRVLAAESAQPLVGVQITVKGTTTGTLTNEQGAFLLIAPADAPALIFQMIGFRTVEVPIAGPAVGLIEVEMEAQALSLEGIVVTALGVQREKTSLGYSVQNVLGTDISEVPELNLVNSLQGRVAGVQITNAGPTGGSSRIVIRGSSSITGNNQPLFIIDGIPVDNSAPTNSGYGGIDTGNLVQDIDPNNIESISVLKGPNAAALYGSRASNGAIVITTKSGTRGLGGLGVTVTSSMTAETPLRLPSYQNQYGQGVNGEFKFVDGEGGGTWDFVDESWGPRLDGRPIDQFTGPAQPWLPQPDNVSSFFETGTTWNTNVSVTKAGDNANVRLSLTNTQVDGMAPGEEIDRLSLQLKGGANITNKLSTTASLNYMDQEGRNRMGTGYDEDNPMQSFIWFGRQVDMDALKNYKCTGNEPTGCADGGQYNWNYNYHNNPYWEQLVNTNGDERDRVIGHVESTYQLSDWITATGRVGRDWSREHQKNVVAFNSLDDAGDGGFGEVTRFRSETNYDLLVNATRQLTSDINMDVNAGGNVRQSDFENSGVNVSALTAPDIYSIANAAETPIPFAAESHKEVKSLFGSVSLNYKGYLNVDLTGRNDWSSTLPEGNNSYFYPSVSTAFMFSRALGMESDAFSSGKLRASWTRVGNDTNPYQLAAVYNGQVGWGSTPMFAVPNGLPNINLKPEQTTSWEVGADLGFLHERLGFVLTYYDNTTKDQILGVQISSTSGYTSRTLNAGEVRNWGWELLLESTPIRLDNGFQWDMTLNWARNQSEVVDLYGDELETLVLGSYWSLNVEARKGEPYGVMFGNGYLRCDDIRIAAGACSSDQAGMWMLNSAGRPRIDGTRKVLGNYNPDWTGGIQNRFSYGDFDMSVLLDGQKGGNVFSVTNWFGEYAGVLESTLRGRENDFCDPGIIVEGVLPDGSNNTSVKTCPESYFGSNFGNHEASIDDASYIKLREVRLGYQLPGSLVDRMGFSSGEIALIGRNLALWSKVKNIDPETAFDASNVQGFEFGQFPSARSIGMSLTIRP
jgi:TonB-linked SusC/RagA family outer membrane protein